ncbi:RusA family crossover junction endodeoxyribonuclease [Candidatus Nitrospira bockiana]
MLLVPGSTRPAIVTDSSLTMHLPLPPSINHQYATVNGRRVLSAAGRRYKLEVARQLMVALSQSPARDALLATFRSKYLALSLRCRFGAPLRRDLDGGLKITQDAVCEALGLNDNRVFEVHLYKDFSSTSPSMELTLSTALAAEHA